MKIGPALLLCLSAGAAYGQQFDVASVKRSSPNTPGVVYHMPSGRFKAEGMTLLYLIAFCYDIDADRIEGLPSWASRDRFDIEAVGGGQLETNPAKMETPEKKAMVRALLAERFGLKVEIATRAVPCYSLREAPRGNKLVRNSDKPYLIHAGPHSYMFQKATMAALAKALSTVVRSEIGRPVVDKTGIEGEFDFSFAWAPPRLLSAPGTEPATPLSNAVELPSIFDALTQQLGLQLKPDRQDLPFVTVLKADPPSPN